MSEHTPEPWEVSEHVPTRIDERNREGVSIHGVAMACDGRALGEANAKHIVECVNACAGIEAPATTVPELVTACKTCDEEIAIFLATLEGFNIEPRSPAATRLRATGHLAKRVLAKAGKTR